MAAITVTAANVRSANTRATITQYVASAAITAGQPVHYNSTTEKVQKGDCTSLNNIVGIAIGNASADGDIIGVINKLGFDPGATVSVGTQYYVGRTAGEIVPFADLSSPDEVIYLFYADTTTSGIFNLAITGLNL